MSVQRGDETPNTAVAGHAGNHKDLAWEPNTAEWLADAYARAGLDGRSGPEAAAAIRHAEADGARTEVPAGLAPERTTCQARPGESASGAHQQPASSALGVACLPIDWRWDQLVECLARRLQNTATRADVAGLVIIEAHVRELGLLLEDAKSRIARLDTVEAQLAQLTERMSDERLAAVAGRFQPTVQDIEFLAVAVARHMDTRLQPEPQDDRILELQGLISQLIEGQQQDGDSTLGVLGSLQQTMNRILDRLASVEKVQAAAAGRPTLSAPRRPKNEPAAQGPDSAESKPGAAPMDANGELERQAPQCLHPALPKAQRKPAARPMEAARVVIAASHPSAADSGERTAAAKAGADKRVARFGSALGFGAIAALLMLLIAGAGFAYVHFGWPVKLTAAGEDKGPRADPTAGEQKGPTKLDRSSRLNDAGRDEAAAGGSGPSIGAGGEGSGSADERAQPQDAAAFSAAAPSPARTHLPAIPTRPAPSAGKEGSVARGASLPSAQPLPDEDAETRAALEALPPAIAPPALRQAAASGDPYAQFEVAARLEGRGIAQDLKQAFVWYHRAAASGVAVAQFRLGTLYEHGLAVKADPALACLWYRRGAEQGNIKAMHNLAVLNAKPEDGKSDYATAAHWFRQAAEHGLMNSQFNMGVLYESGLGVGKDDRLAYFWFTLAAHSGDADAMRRRDLAKFKLTTAGLEAADALLAAWRRKPVEPLTNDAQVAGRAWMGRQQAFESSTSTARGQTVGGRDPAAGDGG